MAGFAGAITWAAMALAWLPVMAFVCQLLADVGPARMAQVVKECWSPRVFGIWLTSVKMAGAIAMASTLTGLLLHRLLVRRSEAEKGTWMTIHSLGLLASPYILIQGLLNLAGPNSWIQENVLPARWSIYSGTGYFLVQVLLNSGLALLFLNACDARFDRKYSDFMAIYRPSPLAWLMTFFKVRHLPALGVTFTFIFIVSYWNYDSASILRQNLLSLELMAAFGSFYNNAQAAAIALPGFVAILPLAVALYFWISPVALSLRTPGAGVGGKGKFPSAMVLAVLPLAIIGISIGGLVSRFSSMPVAWYNLKLALGDLANSAVVGVSSGIVLALVSMAAACHLRLRPHQLRWVLLSLVLAASVPAVITGIGYIQLRAITGESHWPSGLARLVILNVMLWLPLCMLVSIAFIGRLPSAWLDELRLMNWPASARQLRLAASIVFPTVLKVFMVGFALSIREVPASLLNYTPDAGTIALTIETMLHFEQPDALSALCIAQFMLVGVVWGLVSAVVLMMRKLPLWER
jgi:ABC-type Fe3+ transport system permease subunit